MFMTLTEILRPGCVKVPLAAANKKDAIQELVELLAREQVIENAEPVLKAVLDREAIRSTGMGQGFAIPHGKCANVHRLVMAIGKAKKPIEFDSVDRQPVTLIILLVSPIDQTGPHIQALARISRLMTDTAIRKQLWQSDGPEDIYRLITQFEQKGTTY